MLTNADSRAGDICTVFCGWLPTCTYKNDCHTEPQSSLVHSLLYVDVEVFAIALLLMLSSEVLIACTGLKCFFHVFSGRVLALNIYKFRNHLSHV